MNIKAMEKAADALAEFKPTKQRRKFDMGTFGYKGDCGTTACAAGWLLILGKLPGYTPFFDDAGDLQARSKGGYFSVPFAAETALGLSDDQSIDLFYDAGHSLDRVVKLMRKMIAEEKSNAR